MTEDRVQPDGSHMNLDDRSGQSSDRQTEHDAAVSDIDSQDQNVPTLCAEVDPAADYLDTVRKSTLTADPVLELGCCPDIDAGKQKAADDTQISSNRQHSCRDAGHLAVPPINLDSDRDIQVTGQASGRPGGLTSEELLRVSDMVAVGGMF